MTFEAKSTKHEKNNEDNNSMNNKKKKLNKMNFVLFKKDILIKNISNFRFCVFNLQ